MEYVDSVFQDYDSFAEEAKYDYQVTESWSWQSQRHSSWQEDN